MSLLVPIIVTGEWLGAGGDVPTGSVRFYLSHDLVDRTDGVTVPGGALMPRELDQNGTIAQQLYANDVVGLTPPNSRYFVIEDVTGAGQRTYYVTVPHAPAGSRSVSDGATTQGSPVLVSATADFTGTDVGRYVNVPGVETGATILSVTSTTHASLSMSATATATGLAVLIGAQATLAALAPPGS